MFEIIAIDPDNICQECGNVSERLILASLDKKEDAEFLLEQINVYNKLIHFPSEICKSEYLNIRSIKFKIIRFENVIKTIENIKDDNGNIINISTIEDFKISINALIEEIKTIEETTSNIINSKKEICEKEIHETIRKKISEYKFYEFSIRKNASIEELLSNFTDEQISEYLNKRKAKKLFQKYDMEI